MIKIEIFTGSDNVPPHNFRDVQASVNAFCVQEGLEVVNITPIQTGATILTVVVAYKDNRTEAKTAKDLAAKAAADVAAKEAGTRR